MPFFKAKSKNKVESSILLLSPSQAQRMQVYALKHSNIWSKFLQKQKLHNISFCLSSIEYLMIERNLSVSRIFNMKSLKQFLNITVLTCKLQPSTFATFYQFFTVHGITDPYIFKFHRMLTNSFHTSYFNDDWVTLEELLQELKKGRQFLLSCVLLTCTVQQDILK